MEGTIICLRTEGAMLISLSPNFRSGDKRERNIVNPLNWDGTSKIQTPVPYAINIFLGKRSPSSVIANALKNVNRKTTNLSWKYKVLIPNFYFNSCNKIPQKNNFTDNNNMTFGWKKNNKLCLFLLYKLPVIVLLK